MIERILLGASWLGILIGPIIAVLGILSFTRWITIIATVKNVGFGKAWKDGALYLLTYLLGATAVLLAGFYIHKHF